MLKTKAKSALCLARALHKYSDMEATAVYTALHKEWPPAVAELIDYVLWAKAPLRSERDILRDLRALHVRAHERSEAVQAFPQGMADGRRRMQGDISGHP